MKSASQIAIEALDEVARRMELTWGVDRLPRIVAQEWAGKFYRQLEKLNAALVDEATAGGWEASEKVVLEATRMQAAWLKLDQLAAGAGAEPLEARWFEGRLEDGRLLIVAPDRLHAHRLASDNREAVVWSMGEIAAVLWKFELVNDAKTVWPGAKVENVRVDPERSKPAVDWKKGDDLPDTLKAWAAG